MKRKLRFAIAKYVPDLHRMEPRNLGVVIWADGGAVASRFLGEDDAGHFRSPAIVEKNSRYAYRQWRDYWHHQLKSESIPNRNGEPIARTSPGYFDVLLEKSKEQFRLVDSGHLLEAVSDKEIENVLEELFSRLVEQPQASKTPAENLDLKKSCDQLFSTVNVPLQHNLPVPRHVFGVLRPFVVDYAWGSVAKPSAVFQRVLLKRNQNINGNALMFQAFLTDTERPLRKEQCAALVNAGQKLDDDELSGLKMLEQVATVIDVSKMMAVKQIQEIASLTEVAI